MLRVQAKCKSDVTSEIPSVTSKHSFQNGRWSERVHDGNAHEFRNIVRREVPESQGDKLQRKERETEEDEEPKNTCNTRGAHQRPGMVHGWSHRTWLVMCSFAQVAPSLLTRGGIAEAKAAAYRLRENPHRLRGARAALRVGRR